MPQAAESPAANIHVPQINLLKVGVPQRQRQWNQALCGLVVNRRQQAQVIVQQIVRLTHESVRHRAELLQPVS